MPTFFARRYYRRLEAVGAKEVLLGGLILAFVICAVVGFGFQSLTNEDYLFETDLNALQGIEEPRDIAIAKRMLPELKRRGLRAVGEARSRSTSEVANLLGNGADLLSDYGAQVVYVRSYETTDEARGKLTAMVCDLRSAARAFGACRASRPVQTDSLSTGTDGWISIVKQSAGFWNGRYFTLVKAVVPLSDPATVLTNACRGIAGLQLSYGRPFEAERMVPSAGRLPGSFRYVHRAAFGVGILSEIFLADYKSGTTAWVKEERSAPDAERLVVELGSLKTSLQDVTHESAEYADPQSDLPADEAESSGLTVVSLGHATLAAFPDGRFVRGVYGQSSEQVLADAKAMRASASRGTEGIFRAQVNRGRSTADGPFPDPRRSGWRAPAKAAQFTPDNLYTKINGRADAYLQFHVVGLTFGTYYNEHNTERTIDVYWYDMGKPANAMGIYKSEAAPDATAVSIGKEGYATGGAVFFRKGGAYVQILPATAQEDDAEVALAIARRIAEQIEDASDELWALAAFPKDGRIEGSFSYIAEDAFGLGFLPDVFVADYHLSEGRFTLFIHRAGSSSVASELLSTYIAFFDRYGKTTWRGKDTERRIVAGEVAGTTDVVFAKGRYLGGVTGASDPEGARTVVERFFEQLSAE